VLSAAGDLMAARQPIGGHFLFRRSFHIGLFRSFRRLHYTQISQQRQTFSSTDATKGHKKLKVNSIHNKLTL
jgi:hypothetical protein